MLWFKKKKKDAETVDEQSIVAAYKAFRDADANCVDHGPQIDIFSCTVKHKEFANDADRLMYELVKERLDLVREAAFKKYSNLINRYTDIMKDEVFREMDELYKDNSEVSEECVVKAMIAHNESISTAEEIIRNKFYNLTHTDEEYVLSTIMKNRAGLICDYTQRRYEEMLSKLRKQNRNMIMGEQK